MAAPPPAPHPRRLLWVTAARLLIATFLALATLLAGIAAGGAFSGFTPRLLLSLAVAAYGSSLLAAWWLRRRPAAANLRRLTFWQLGCDLLLVSALVFVSGGAVSVFAFLYGVVVLAAAILLDASAAYRFAGAAIALYTLVGGGLAAGFVSPPADQRLGLTLLSTADFAFAVVSTVLGTVLVTALAGHLATRQRRAAEHAEQLASLGRLAAALAHEIRNPLGSISGSVELVRESAALNAEERRLLDIVQSETNRLDELVTAMLEVGRPKAPQRTCCDLRQLASEVVDLMRRNAALLGSVVIELEQPAQPVLALVDADQLRQVLWNLLKNAVQASSRGQCVQLEVRNLSAQRAMVRVSDSGLGIEAQHLPNLFRTFYSTKAQGVGLGLAVAKQILEAHGADLEVESTQGRGSRFTLRLPSGCVPPPAPACR